MNGYGGECRDASWGTILRVHVLHPKGQADLNLLSGTHEEENTSEVLRALRENYHVH